jgi:RimJ/RimL family protein N-acetyltransferase
MTTNVWQPTHLKDDLVTLLPLMPTDFERLFAVAADPILWEQHPQKDRWKREVFQGFFDGAIASGSAFLTTETKTGNVMGSTRFYDPDAGNSVMVGYTFIGREFWGKGYNPAVKKLMFDYAFQQVDNIFLHIGAGNIRSQTATLRLGANKVREFEKIMGGRPVLHHEYVVQRQKWMQRLGSRP